MKRVIYLPDDLNENKYVLKKEYEEHGLYQRYTPSGYPVHQEWAVVRESDGFQFVIESYNNICDDEVLDAIDNYYDSNKYGFKVLQTKMGARYNYWTVHRSGKKVI